MMSVFLSLLLLSRFGLCLSIIDIDFDDARLNHRDLSTDNIPTTEWDALQDIYEATNGPDWQCCTHGYNAWNFTNTSVNPCTDDWLGITCGGAQLGQYHVDQIDLSKANLLGTIPDSVEFLPFLNYLDLSINSLSGTIPTTIGSLTRLTKLTFRVNYLTGSFPSTILDLHNLTSFSIHSNSFTGTLPNEISNLANIASLFVDLNFFVGTLPSSLGLMTSLTALYLDENYFSNTLPFSLGDLTLLHSLYLGNNDLVGTIPESLGNLLSVAEIYMNGNSMTGTIPSSMGLLQSAEFYYLNDNFFTGTLSTSFGLLSNVVDFDVSTNYLTGVFPSSMLLLPHAFEFYLTHNLMTGPLPNETVVNVRYLFLGHNQFTGGIPGTLTNSSILTQFAVDYNSLSGSLESLFDSADFNIPMAVVQLNNNYFTGSLPSAVFKLANLTTFVASVNCFEGTLPSTICDAVNAQSLVLDGMTSATTCRTVLLPGLSSSYILQKQVDGEIPSCLYALPELATLHLSGNGFNGNFPDDMVLGPQLDELDVSHNRLGGPISQQIQDLVWTQLDLSFNRFSGTLWYNFKKQPYGSVSLNNNRLSGKIPVAFYYMQNIDVLAGNIFFCELSGDELPLHDKDRNFYLCGSNAFNVQYVTWLGLCVIVCFVVVYLKDMWQRNVKYFVSWMKHTDPAAIDHNALIELGRFFHCFLDLTKICTVYICVVLLPLYIGFSQMPYGDYTHEYAYIASAAFLSGIVPFVTEYVLWILFVSAVLVYLFRYLYLRREKELPVINESMSDGTIKSQGTIMSQAKSAFSIFTQSESDAPENPQSIAEKWKIFSFFLTCNLIVVVAANIVYVFLVINAGSQYFFFEQFMLSIFKYGWNYFFIPKLLQKTAEYFLDPKIALSRGFPNRYLKLLIGVSLLNNIVIPVLVVMCISENCFYNMFVGAPQVTSSYNTYVCILSDVNSDSCLIEEQVPSESTFDPPFTYTYLCSSSVMRYYTPAYVSLCIVSTFVYPVFTYYLLQWYESAVEGTVVHQMLELVVPRLHSLVPRLSKIRETAAPAEEKEDISSNVVLFEPNYVVIELATYFGLLLTFGVMFPPLALAFAFTIFVVAYSAKIELGRFLDSCEEYGLVEFKRIVLEETSGIKFAAVMENMMWMLVTVSCFFYTFFLFDTLGDQFTLGRSYWVLIAVPSTPLVMYSAYYLALPRFLGSRSSLERQNASQTSQSVELFPVCSSPLLKLLEVAKEQELAKNRKVASIDRTVSADENGINSI